MRNAIINIIMIIFIFSSCSEIKPDFSMIIESPNNVNSVIIKEYLPAGTVSGYISINFDGQNERKAILRSVKNGKFGWISDNIFAIVSDSISYNNIDSFYYLKNDYNKEIALIICSNEYIDCKSVLEKINYNKDVKEISNFDG